MEIPKSPGNAYRGIGEVVYRNIEDLWPVIKKLEPMERELISQYATEIQRVKREEEDRD
jgi:hypothetical protein